MPDLTVVLKVSPEVCIERIIKRGEYKTLFEKKRKLKKTWKAYEMLSKKFKNVKVVNGEQSIKEVSKEIKEVVHSKLNF